MDNPRPPIPHEEIMGALGKMIEAPQPELPNGGGHCDFRNKSEHYSGEEAMALRRFIIEREIPAVGTFDRDQLRGAAAKSNEVLGQLGPDIQWVESYVADNKTFCIYLAKDEAIIRKHAEISGFPATKITEVRKMIDPTTAAG
jgi:hypothetical protein